MGDFWNKSIFKIGNEFDLKSSFWTPDFLFQYLYFSKEMYAKMKVLLIVLLF